MEIWVPYGDVESLLTIQAENLGELVDPAPESHSEEIAQTLRERLKGFERLVVCDSRPATIKLLRSASASIPPDSPLKLTALWPKPIEEKVPDLKGRLERPSPPSVAVRSGDAEVMLAPELASGRNFLLATGAPDPLFGYQDARVAAGLALTSGGRRLAYDARETDASAFMQETRPYHTLVSLLEGSKENAYATIVTRGGEPFSLIDGGPRDARSHLVTQQVSPAKGIVVGGGGRGYDDTFSGVLRLTMGLLGAVRKGGDILLVGECADGIGSEALRMQAQGRIGESNLKRAFYADGLEETSYLSKLREDYTVTILSSLPDLYTSGRFRFKAAKSAPEALQRVFSSAGRSAKLHVFTRSPETLVS